MFNILQSTNKLLTDYNVYQQSAKCQSAYTIWKFLHKLPTVSRLFANLWTFLNSWLTDHCQQLADCWLTFQWAFARLANRGPFVCWQLAICCPTLYRQLAIRFLRELFFNFANDNLHYWFSYFALELSVVISEFSCLCDPIFFLLWKTL